MAERGRDVLCGGGGVVGAGSALDAVTRGLSTAIIEARDWASGTSSRSSKLMHGGLRYLEMLDFGLVNEALHERGLLLNVIAPHLVRPVQFLYPLQHRFWERPYVGAGVLIYDGMAYASGTAKGLKHHRHLTRKGALREAPCLRADSLAGAIPYMDAQVDDARHTMTVVRTAATFGALAASRVRVTDFLRQGERVTGARVTDLVTGKSFEVRANQIINATGVWTDDTQALADTRGQFHVRASKGIHLVVPRDRLQSNTGIILRTEKSVLFIIPWGRHWIIGTTDTDWSLSKEHPAASSRDIDYLLEHVNSVLNSPLTREDVEGVYAGLRPLLSGGSDLFEGAPGRQLPRHRLPARARQLGAQLAADPRGRRGRLRGAAAAAVGRVGGHLQALPRARGRAPGAWPGGGGGRQVHDLPGDGEGRGRRGQPGDGRPGAALGHGRPAAG